MTPTSTTSWVVVLCALAATSCSSDAGDAGPAPSTTPTATSGAPTPGGGSCAFPTSSVERIAARWRSVARAPDERTARSAAVRYRDAIGRVRASFAVACPELEETFNQVFVDAQFLVESTGAADDLELTELVRNAEALVTALGLQDEVRFVDPDPSRR